jgi:transposase
MGKQYGARIISKVLELQAAGYTQREIAKELGFETTQIKDLVKRYRRKQRKGETIGTSSGRPQKRTLTSMQEKDLRIKKLEREIALYQSFLQAVGRM